MRFNPKARLDRSQVQVRRGGGRRSAGGGMPFPVPASTGGRIGGGLGGIVVLIIILVVTGAVGGGGLLGGGSGSGGSGTEQGAVSTDELDQCQSGADANSDPDCARLAVVNSIQSFWSQELPQETGTQYQEADTVMFQGSVETGCGPATAEVGPFYCPVRGDHHVYLDTSFFRDMLQGQLGAEGGDFAEAYVIAHEYGHHIENLLGYMGRVRTQQGANSDSVRLELMADCLAGVWGKHATTAPDADGQVLIQNLDQHDVHEAINAAQAVGDDRIQKMGSGRVNPEQWTHGSAAAREMWFMTGFRQGSVQACDTFQTDALYPGQ